MSPALAPTKTIDVRPQLAFELESLTRNSPNLEQTIREIHDMLHRNVVADSSPEAWAQGGLHEALSFDSYLKAVQEDHALFLVARDKSTGEVIGALLAREEVPNDIQRDLWVPTSYYQDGLVEPADGIPPIRFVRFYEVAVDKAAQRKGIGTSLSNEFERHFEGSSSPVVAFCDVITGIDGSPCVNRASFAFHLNRRGFQLGPGMKYDEHAPVEQWSDTTPSADWNYTFSADEEGPYKGKPVSMVTLVKCLTPGFELTPREDSLAYRLEKNVEIEDPFQDLAAPRRY